LVKKVVKIFAIIIVTIILLNVILFLTFSIPSVQKYAADFALKKLKPMIGTEASIDGIRIKLFNTVELKGVYLEDKQQDTLFYAGTLSTRIHPWDLLDNRVSVRKVALENFTGSVYRETPEAPFNFQFLIDAFAGKDKDTTQQKKEKAPWHIVVEDLLLKNGSLRYHILSEPETPGKFNAAHIDVKGLQLRASADFLRVEDMRAQIKKLEFTEHSGIQLTRFQADVRGKDSLFSGDKILVSFNDSELEVKEASYHLSSKAFVVRAKSDHIDVRNVALFADGFGHLGKPLSFDIDVKGQLPQVELQKLTASYGSGTKIRMEGMLSDYSNYNDSKINLNIQEATVSPDDMEAFAAVGSPKPLPEQLFALGNISLRLKAQGKMSRFAYDGALRTSQGNVSLSGQGMLGKDFKSFSFEGPVNADNIQMANIMGEELGVDDVTLATHIRVASDSRKQLSASADGSIVSALYKGYQYTDLFFDGSYSPDKIAAHIHTDTERNKLDISADMTMGGDQAILVKGVIDKLDLNPFVTIEKWENPSLTTRIDGQLSGGSIDNMVGTVVIDSTSLSAASFIYNPGPVYLQALADEGEGKKLQLYSSFLEAELSGDYFFSTAGRELMAALHPHLPSLIPQPEEAEPLEGLNNFRFTVNLKNTEDLSYALSLPFYNVEPATIQGSVDMVSGQSVVMNAHVPRLMFGNNDIRETKVTLQSGPAKGIAIEANTYLVQDDGYINARLNTDVASDSLMNRLFFDVQNSVAQANGQLQIGLQLDRDAEEQLMAAIRFYSSDVLFNNKTISFSDATIDYRKDHIDIRNFGMRERDMLILGIEGIASKTPSDSIRVYFNNTELSNLLAAFNVSNIEGAINGDIFISQALGDPRIRTEQLRIDDIKVYNEPVGTFHVDARWDNLHSGLGLDAYLDNKTGVRPLEVKGFIPTGDTIRQPMNVKLNIRDFALTTFKPLTTTIFSDLSGNINSDISVTGSVSEPEVKGWLGIDGGMMKVAYTDVTYRISDTIHVDKSNIGLNNLVIYDEDNHTATLSVSLSHSNFGRMVYNVGFEMNDFLLLNNSRRTDLMAYGTLRLSGNIKVSGSQAGIFGDAFVSSSSRSDVTVVIPQSAATAEQYSGVIYINTPTEKEDSLSFLRKREEGKSNAKRTSSANSMPINMRAIVNLTPLLRTKVFINPTTGDALDVNGTGEMTISYNSKAVSPMQIHGDYVIEEGKIHYNLLQNLRAIDFNIRKGSTLTMIGDPMNTRFNIIAYHQVTTDLATLNTSFTAELSNTRVPVNALLEIRGDLQRMDLQYGIELPDATNDMQQKVNSLISTEEAKIRQFASLVATGSFFSSGGDTQNTNLGTNMFTSLAATGLTKGLDALFARALKNNWTVSTNFESQDGTFDNVRMGVDVSTRLFDDRLRITTNLSYGDQSTLNTDQAFMGEFEAEYDINNWLMLRAYNRANQRFYRRSPFTQGVGVVVTKQGHTFRNLFRFDFRRKENE